MDCQHERVRARGRGFPGLVCVDCDLVCETARLCAGCSELAATWSNHAIAPEISKAGGLCAACFTRWYDGEFERADRQAGGGGE